MECATKYANTAHETPDFINFYNSTDPKLYEDMCMVIEFSDEQLAMKEIVKKGNEDGGISCPHDAAILDVGCGTGMFGKLLWDEGYNNMVGTDASSNFLKAASEKGIYKETFEHWFGTGREFPSAHQNRYDVVTACGCLSKGHIEKDGLDEIHAALKVGGFLVAGWRSYRLVPGAQTGFYEKLEAMKADGKFDKEEVRH